MTKTVLIVEDTESLALLYRSYLVPTGLETVIAPTGNDALLLIKQTSPDLIVLDIMLPDINGMDILEQLPQADRSKVVILTAHASKELAVQAIRYGASDFIEKPIDGERFRITINNALKLHSLTQTVNTYQLKYRDGRFCDLIGSSPEMRAVYQIIESAALSKASIFITGESGTGKELCSRAVHQCSERRNNTFFAINCAAIPNELMESEIFGHVKGAFTGATHNRDGAATIADGGTLFLDEICEMSLELQSKLLRFIQTGSFQKVGSEKQQRVDTRFICATNRDPWEEVCNGRFREDLYYRLYVIPIALPPLRSREDDVLQIADALFDKISQEEGKEFIGIDDDVMQCLREYSWPGNVRQLENAIRNTVVLSHSTKITREMLPKFLTQNACNHVEQRVVETVLSDNNVEENEGLSDEPKIVSNENTIEPLAIIEKRYIERAIEVCNNNVPKAAALLDVSPSTIYRKMKTW